MREMKRKCQMFEYKKNEPNPTSNVDFGWIHKGSYNPSLTHLPQSCLVLANETRQRSSFTNEGFEVVLITWCNNEYPKSGEI